jgi:hypothetical protein
MRGVRLDFVAGVWVACLAGGCSLVVNTDGLSGSATEAGPPAGQDGDVPDAGEAAADSAGGDADASVDSGVPDARPTDSGPLDAVSDSRAADAQSDAPSCKTDLSNIGTADFAVALTLTTSQTGIVAVANQRNVCNFGTFWDVRLSNGNLYVETDDGTHYAMLTTSGVLANDGKPHAIKVQRRSQKLTAFIDGISVGTAGSTSSFGVLPALQSGVDPCDGHPGNSALVGTVAGLCLTNP